MQLQESSPYQSLTKPCRTVATTIRRNSIKMSTLSSVITMTPVVMLRLNGGACPRTLISLSSMILGHRALAFRLRSQSTTAAKCRITFPTLTSQTASQTWQTYPINWRHYKCAQKSLISTLIPMNIKTVVIKWHTKKQILISTQCLPVRAKWWSAKSCLPNKRSHSGRTNGSPCHSSLKSLARQKWQRTIPM